jgi:CRISPR-associated endoribonuclease Cas6
MLPVHYNHILQSAIYANLGPDFGTFIHDEGYERGSRIFKPLTFSRLRGSYRLDRAVGTISFDGKVHLVVCSPVEEICRSLGTSLLVKGFITLAGQKIPVECIEANNPVVLTDELTVVTLSPVVVYSTLTKGDGSPYTCYYQPGEKEFEELVSRNLASKYEAFLGKQAPMGTVSVKPLRQPRLHVVYYKDTVIKGYSGPLLMTGPRELLLLALNAGLGSKNAQGFGCLAVVGHSRA